MIILNLASGTQINETVDDLKQISAWLLDKKANPETESVMSYLGYGGPRIVLSMAPVTPGPQRGYILVNVPLETKLDPIIERVREHLLRNFPDVAAEVKPFWLGGTEPGLVQFRVQGTDADTLKGLAEQVKQMLLAEPGTVNVKDDWEIRVIKLVVNIDQARASRAGVTSADIATSLNTALKGMQVSTFREGDQAIPIVLRGDQDEQITLDRLRTIYVFSADGSVSVPLNQVADFVGIPQDGAIQRRNGVRTVTVSAKSLELSAGALTKLMRPQLAALQLPAGYRIGIGGELEASGNAQNALFQVHAGVLRRDAAADDLAVQLVPKGRDHRDHDPPVPDRRGDGAPRLACDVRVHGDHGADVACRDHRQQRDPPPRPHLGRDGGRQAAL